MANRSYIYLKNGDEARILAEGVYTIPYFWQLFWDEEDLRTPISLWETAEKLEEDEEEAETFYQEQNVDILLPIEKFQQNALQNRSFLEENVPQAVQLYDAFVRYILANVKDGDVLGFDLLDVVFMDQVSVVSDKLLKNIRAIRENQPKDLDFSLTEKNLIGLAMGFPDYYASELLPEDNILDSVAYQDELKKMNPQDDKQGGDMTGADTKANKWRNGLVYLFILALVIRLIFYMMVNIGAFTGKTIIDPLRNVIGEQAYIYINYFSGAMTIIALLAVILLYKSTHTAGEGKSLREISRGFMKIITNWRLLILILIVTGFWMVQQQLYATMPKYVIRMAGETAKPGWIANVNPFVVVCFVSFITRLMAKRSAITSMNVGMFLIPFSALLMACGNLLGNDIISGMSNITLMMVAGIIVQALAECFISPRYLEYFSLQAPKGEEGMYLGFSHLHSFLSSIFGFGLAGILLTKYCPDPTLFETHAAWEAASVNAHYIWYYFAAIGLIAAIALLLFAKITESIDKKKKASR